MQIVLEQKEIERLLKLALKEEGVRIPDSHIMRIRKNNKKGTIRVAFVEPEEISHG